ncbi:MAG: hypothetical protein JJU19_17550 [Pararhodobacter sp.]|nr:hypothetical protein [Pararhodobacter sp.]
MFLISHDTVANVSALDIRWVPRRFLGRTALWPRGGSAGLWARLIFEIELLRYLAALSPFVLATLIWRDYALAIAQAPIPMLILIYLVEARLLRASPARRATLVSADQADRGLDLLRARARAILTRIAANRGLGAPGMPAGRLHLVIEQSEMLRVPVLTLVSVQAESPGAGGTGAEGPALLRLTADERALITDTLFAPPLSERALQHIGLARKIELHDLTFEPAQVSGHARLSAMMAARQGPAPSMRQ